MRIALGIEYDGSAYFGWERQREGKTVQDAVEAALSKVAAQPVNTVCAGRTDSGVHALGQVVHFDTEAVRSPRSWTLGANSYLPEDVAVVWARGVPQNFHARFAARRRHYRYIISNSATRPALLRRRVTWECRTLNVDDMGFAASQLVGEHDFSAYRALSCQAKNPVRTVYRLDVARCGAMIRIDIVANAFLHHMVRNVAGVLMGIGMGKASPDWAKRVLDGRDRSQGGVTAPSDGLYLVGVQYPPEFALDGVSLPQALWYSPSFAFEEGVS